MKFMGVRTIKWTWFPEFGLGTVCFQDLADSLSKCGCFSFVWLEVGVSSSAGSICADPRCADMLVGVGGWVGGQVTGLEFPELSRKVKLSSIVNVHKFRI